MIISQSQRNIQNCVVAEFVAMFNRGYQPLALLKEMQPLNLSRLITNKRSLGHRDESHLIYFVSIGGQ